jgi:hypothetical protein
MNSPFKPTKYRKIINILFSVIFTIFAVIQLNDPDPIIWFSLYIIVAIVALISNYKRIPEWIIWVLIIGLSVYASFHFLYFIDFLQTENKNELFGEMVYEKPYLEGTREFLGLIMAIGALVYFVTFKKY